MDTGYFMSDERSAHGRIRPDMAVRDDWVFKAYNQFPVDIANVSSHDLRYFSTALEKAEFARRAGAEPLLNRLVSANTLSEAAGFVAPRPFIVRDVPSRQPGAKPVRVAFIGLTETAPEPPAGFKFVDPVEAANELRSLTAETTDPAIRDTLRVLGDAISVGNISDATGVAIGRNIRQVINRFELSPDATAALLDLRAMQGAALGLDATQYRWGSLLIEGRQFMFDAPWLPVSAGIAVVMAVLGINLLGDALRDVLDPRDWSRL